MIAQEIWQSLLSWYNDTPAFRRRAILRSLFLRQLESTRGLQAGPRAVLGAMRRLAKLLLSRRKDDLEPAQVWVVAEASTPSHLGTALAVVDLCHDVGIGALLVAANEHIRRRARKEAGLALTNVDRLASRLRFFQRVGTAARAASQAFHELAGEGPQVRFLARVRLALEAGLAAVACRAFEEAIRVRPPTLMMGPSEYFAVGAAACEAASSFGIPWVTVQHGAINITYAPSLATEYWVWGPEAARALESLAGESPLRISTLGALRLDEAHSESAASAVSEPKQSPQERRITLFTQSHGLEYDPVFQDDLAEELLAVLDRVPDTRLLVKIHPNEKTSIFRTRLKGHPRVSVIKDPDAKAAQIARISDCCIAVDSTALLESMLVGTLAVAVNGVSGSLVVQPVAAHVISLGPLATFLVTVLTDKAHMEAALGHQRERLPELLANVGGVRAAHEQALKRLTSG